MTKDNRMNIRLSSEVKERLRTAADEMGLDMTAVINIAITEYLNSRDVTKAIIQEVKNNPSGYLAQSVNKVKDALMNKSDL